MSETNGHRKPAPDSEPFDSGGATYWLAKVGPGIRKEFAARVRLRARQQLIEDRDGLGEEDYAAAVADLNRRIDAGHYRWNPPFECGGTGPGQAIEAALSELEGRVELCQTLLEPAHGLLPSAEVLKIITANPDSATAALLAAMGLPPNSEAPETKTTTPGTKTEKPNPTNPPTPTEA